MTDDEEEYTFTAEDQETAWEVNALLTSLHEGAVDLYEKILTESRNPVGLLVMSTATLKAMLDILIDMVNEFGPSDPPVTFGTLIRLTAESLTEVQTSD